MTYADYQRLHLGHEYLERTYQAIDQPANHIIRIYGDSTTVMAPSPTDPARPRYSVETVLQRALWAAGLPDYILVNHGNSGDRWDTFRNVIPDIADGQTSTIMIKLGINDAGLGDDYASAIAILCANMDCRLSAIRCAPNGDLTKLAIILVGPNSTNDVPGRRDAIFYDLARAVYVEMARKHRCAYFDSYGYMQDSRPPAAGFYLDDPYDDGVRGIHPAGYLNNRLWGSIVDEFFPRGAVACMARDPSVAVPLLAGWSNTGPGYAQARAFRDPHGRIFIDGMISGGATAYGTIFAELPNGFRPSVAHQFVTLGQSTFVGIHIAPSGKMAFQTVAQSASTSLGGINFMAA